ncbi:MAG: Tad domain-containing protein [Selenomonadaceae bacterium]|nr:Tad domain-containing protein [Selenomonadaceae bacterium]
MIQKFFQERGQAMVLFVLFIPLLFIFAGIGIDLGWYYLNVSRLQNAADAAAVAGAYEMIKDEASFKDYDIILVDNKFSIYPEPDANIDTTPGDIVAADYARKNLSSDDAVTAIIGNDNIAYAYTMTDDWSREEKSKVTMTPYLGQNGEDFYYVVHLVEDIQHLFMPGRYDPMAAPVVAVAKVTKATNSSGGNPKVVFDPNGGHFVNPDDGSTTESSLSIGDITKTIKESGSIAVIVPDGYSSTPERDQYEFLRYWTNDNGLIVPYGTVLTADNVEEFFKKYDPNAQDNDDYDWENAEITLYAQWVKVKYKPVNLIFDPNGGTFSDGTNTPDSKQIKAPKEMKDDETTDPITPNKGTPGREGYEFYGWSTDKNADANSLVANYISDGKQLTKNEISNLFGNNTSVTLYAVWKKINPTVTEEEIKPHNNKTLWEQMQYLIAKNVYDYNWRISTIKYGFGKLTHNSFDTSKTDAERYINNHYYTEYINLGNTDANGRAIKDETQYFIDFHENNWFVAYRDKLSYAWTNYRVHSLFNVNTAYAARSGYNDDPLYLRIEGEDGTGADTPIRQIVLNINVSNLADGLRPLFFFYDGPNKENAGANAEPQPVILNLNADFKGVLFMPDVPVVINGNGHTFEGFIIAKEYRYLSTSGTKVKYSITGQTNQSYSNNKIYVNTSTGNVNSTVATGANAFATYNSYATKTTNGFNLSSSSKFRTFTADTDVNYMYVFYDNSKTLDETPFHEYCDLTKDLIPMYKLDDAGNQVRVTKWEDVKLYDSDDFNTRNEIPKQLTDTNKIRTVRLDSNGNPAPLYDEAGNPVYFCDDYIKLTGTYTVFTLDKVTEGIRDPKEFLLTTVPENVSDTDDWK